MLLTLVMLFALCSAAAQQEAGQEFKQAGADLAAIPEANSYREEIVIVANGNVTTLDPAGAWSYQACEIYRMVYDTLLTYKDGVYYPRLAAVWEWANDEASVMHVVLRDDAYFTNGEKVTAEDVAFSLDRATYSNVTAYYDHCEILGEYELNIVLSAPCVDFPFMLTDTSTSVVCKSACEADPDWGFAITSGPFMYDLDNYVSGDSVALVRNDNYWGQLPNTKKFTFRTMSDTSVAVIALQNGEVDWVAAIYDTDIAQIKDDPNVTVYTYPGSNIQYFAFNTVSGGNLTDINLRKAVAYAVDKNLLRIAVGQDTAKIANTMWGWNESGYFDDFDEVYTYNPDKAREYVALVEDPSFRIMVNGTYEVQKLIALMLQEMCANVGITTEIETTDPAGISASTKWGSATHELLVYNISLSDSNTSIWEFYMDKGTKNRAFCSDPRVQELLALAAANVDNYEYYAEIQKINNEYLYYLPTFYLNVSNAYTTGMGGVTIRMSGGQDFTYACIPQ